MFANEQSAYNAFLKSGSIQDYLSYINVKRNNIETATGELIAYHDRCDRTEGTLG